MLVLAIYAVIGVIEFVYVGIKAIIYFFSGRNLFGEFPEDIKAREVMTGKDTASVEISSTPSQTPTQDISNSYIIADNNNSDLEDNNNGVDINNYDE